MSRAIHAKFMISDHFWSEIGENLPGRLDSRLKFVAYLPYTRLLQHILPPLCSALACPR